MNQCKLEGEEIYFEYLESITLEEKLHRLLEQDREGQAAKLLESVPVRYVIYRALHYYLEASASRKN